MSADLITPDPKPSKSRSGLIGRVKRAQEWWYREFRRIIGAWVFALVLLFIGTIMVVLVDTTDFLFSTNVFCGTVCHVMESTVYKELQESTHWTTPTGVRATCADCHVSGRLSLAMVDHFIGTGELFVWMTNDFSKPGAFEEFRPAAANRERFKMLGNNSETCAHCHVMEGIKPERIRGQNAHKDAIDRNIPCIACHFNLTHKEVEPSEAFLNAVEQYLGQGEETTEEEVTPDESGEEPAAGAEEVL
ncbi:MAG: napC [Gammaproteobacteria bacterium]|nr:napC [Gammaproteobacteria bacterium]